MSRSTSALQRKPSKPFIACISSAMDSAMQRKPVEIVNLRLRMVAAGELLFACVQRACARRWQRRLLCGAADFTSTANQCLRAIYQARRADARRCDPRAGDDHRIHLGDGVAAGLHGARGWLWKSRDLSRGERMTVESAIRSSWRSFRAPCIPLPRRWARRCGALRSRPTSRSGAIIPAPFSMAREESLPWAIICRCISAPCPCRCRRRLRRLPLRPATSRSSTIPMPEARIFRISPWCCRSLCPDGTEACVLCFQSRPPCRRGRNVCGIDGAGERNFSGGHQDPSSTDCARRPDRPRDAEPDSAQRPHCERA